MRTLTMISAHMRHLPVHEQHRVRDALLYHGPTRALELAARLRRVP